MKLLKALGATSEIWQVFIMDSKNYGSRKSNI